MKIFLPHPQRGGHKIDQLYQRFLEGFHGHMGLVKVKVAAVHVHGNLAVAHTVEEVGEPAKNHFTPARMKFKASEVVRYTYRQFVFHFDVSDCLLFVFLFVLSPFVHSTGETPCTGDHDHAQNQGQMVYFVPPCGAYGQ